MVVHQRCSAVRRWIVAVRGTWIGHRSAWGVGIGASHSSIFSRPKTKTFLFERSKPRQSGWRRRRSGPETRQIGIARTRTGWRHAHRRRIVLHLGLYAQTIARLHAVCINARPFTNKTADGTTIWTRIVATRILPFEFVATRIWWTSQLHSLAHAVLRWMLLRMLRLQLLRLLLVVIARVECGRSASPSPVCVMCCSRGGSAGAFGTRTFTFYFGFFGFSA